MLPYFGERFGNASSLNTRGVGARRVIDEARGLVAALLGAPEEEIVLTSSATESNNLAIKGIAQARGTRRRRLVAASTEHVSVLHPLRSLERQGFRVELLPVDSRGFLDPEVLRHTLDDDTLLVSVATASPEIGTLQPIPDLCRVARSRGITVHCDATLT